MSKKLRPEPPATARYFPVVGVGASAGGLDAFKKLLKNIPPDTGMAYVLVQHLSPEHESLLPELLAPETTLPVYEIADEINLAPNHIYILPEDRVLSVMDGKLILDRYQPSDKRHKLIDTFFTSLGEVYYSFSRGIILSGSGCDGTQGLKAIKERGGITFVQNPESAKFDSMPQNAVRSGAADFVLEIEDIPKQLLNINHAYQTSHAYAEENESVPKTDEDIFKQILRLLRLRTGNDFSHYKQPTIRRRIARRMVLSKREEPTAYLNFLRNNINEQDALFNDILIPVSYFFRDSKIFETLKENALPLILEKKKPEEGIRVWVTGCSTGEEAYSVAIILHEFLRDKMPDAKVQIFASDISENVIAKARAAIYNRQEVQNVSEERLKAYFTKIDGVYHINKEIRDMCVFAVHNFVKDPPFAKMDMITCRNVLIYLDPFLQKKALTTFHYALRPHGILFLGKSETAGQVNTLFSPLIKNHKVYIRKTSSASLMPSFESTDMVTHQDKKLISRKKAVIEPDFQKLASEILFSRYTPAGVIINEQKEIVHFHGDTGPFLLPPPGKPNFNVFKMVREGLAFELRNALLKLNSNNDTVLKENIPLKGKEYLVNIEIIPLITNSEKHCLVLFHKNMMPLQEKKSTSQRKNADRQRIRQLEDEIEQMRDDIRRVTEDQEAANEELQSANEELLSNSEELQTLNEELETSAEELQSNNEELITVNDELMDRQEQLMMSRLYSEAIVETIREPLLVLDRELRIKSANASFYKYFNTTESDIEGRLFFEIGSSQWNIQELKNEFENVLYKKVRLEDYEVKTVFTELGERTMLLNAQPIINDNFADQLILVAIEDITKIRAANALLLQNNRELEANNKELSSFSYIASHDLQEPLRKIHTFSKMIIDKENMGLTENARNYLDRILVSTLRMQHLIEDLLNFSQINSLNDSDFLTTDIALLLEEVQSDLRELIHEKKAIITMSPMPVLKVSPPLIRQLFINLISNALKYSKPDVAAHIKIHAGTASAREISLLGGDADSNYCKIRFSDNGIGFPQEQALKIFEPFQRLHARDKYEGTGIGLAICKKIMLKHQGFITAESKPGIGSVFSLYLPNK